MTPQTAIFNEKSKATNIFIRIKDERTPFGNIFFRLDQLTSVSVVDNSGLTPLLKVSDGYFEPSVTYEQFIDFINSVINDVNNSEDGLKIYELVVNDKTVREQHSRTEKIMELP